MRRSRTGTYSNWWIEGRCAGFLFSIMDTRLLTAGLKWLGRGAY